MFDGVGCERTETSANQAGTADCVCTTPWKVHPWNEERLELVAGWFQGRKVNRSERSIRQLMMQELTDTVVVADVRPKLYHRSNPEQPVFFHPGMAQQRLAVLAGGGRERLVACAQVEPGDTVVDATLGLGTDSLVLAQAVGEQGKVVAIETSFLLARLFLFEKYHPGPQYPWLAPLLQRIDVQIGNHTEILAKMPSNSADVVLFDPMFRNPPKKETNLSPARSFTEASPLQEQAWREAQRVARRTVVLKERADSGELERFSLVPDKPRAHFSYGVWHKSES